ncbi:hypothetical protein N9901_01350 [Flavobacteriaceae bacterium]|nr:hypothetical protein [Flavobacteriaceae bacterium]
MCDLTKQFKLCTCNFDPKDVKYTWKIFRKKSDLINDIMGEYYLPVFDLDNMPLAEVLEYYMDYLYEKNQLFDTKIELIEGDRLVFYEYDKILFQYQYSMHRISLYDCKKQSKHPIIESGFVKFNQNTITKKDLNPRDFGGCSIIKC